MKSLAQRKKIEALAQEEQRKIDRGQLAGCNRRYHVCPDCSEIFEWSHTCESEKTD